MSEISIQVRILSGLETDFEEEVIGSDGAGFQPCDFSSSLA